MNQPSTNVVEIKLSVNQLSTKSVEINFQWINQCGWDQVKCEPAIDQDGRDQVQVNQPSTNVVEIKLSVNQQSTKMAEIKF